MNAPILPLAVRETTAAKMLDMSQAEFRRLVGAGALPPPARVGGCERWRVADIEAILNGSASLPEEDFEL
jgi:predicted DNA-binding transcriptional regulator AlpA